VNCSAPHPGHCRNVSARRFSAEIELISLASSARLTPLRETVEIMEIDRIRCRAADLGTRQV